MFRSTRLGEFARDRRRGWLLAALAVAAFGILAAAIARIARDAKPPTLRISSGNTEGMWYPSLLGLARDTPPDHLRVVPVVTNGSLEMLEGLESGSLDFAFVQGGYDVTRFPDLRQVAGLSIEPVHLLVRGGLHAEVTADLGKLRGKSVNLGTSTHAGIYWLGREILAFAGLAPGDYAAGARSSESILAERDPAKLPGALFIATTPPSPLVRHLVVDFGYRLVPLPFGDAFRLGAIYRGEGPPADGMGVSREHIQDAKIPAYAYRVSPAVPPGDVPTLGTRRLLLTHRRTRDTTVVRLLDALLNSRVAKAMQPPLDAGIVRVVPEVPWHPGAVEYRRRDEPLITGERVGLLSNTLQIFLPLGGGLLFLWGWLKNRGLARHEERFERYFARVIEIERQALAIDRDLRAIRGLHRDLCLIKDEALGKVAEGDAHADALSASLLAHISDVRLYLADLARDGAGSTEGRPGAVPP